MNQEQSPKQKKRKSHFTSKIKQQFSQLLHPHKQNSVPKEGQEEKKQIDPYYDLCEFEYIYSSMKSVSEASVLKYSEWIKIMKNEPIDQVKLSNLLQFGIEDELKAVRGVSWRVLLGQQEVMLYHFSYLPPLRRQWVNILEKNKKNYLDLIEEHILSKLRKGKPAPCDDHPLNRSKDSYWNNYFADQGLWQKIEKDTKRTRSKEGFFHAENTVRVYEEIELAYLAIFSKRQENTCEYNYDVLSRVLFLYAKLNDGFYQQGMNEIVAILYYCFSNDDSILLKKQAEVDTFYCFCILMSEFKNYFTIQENQLNNVFIQEKVRLFGENLKKIDFKLFEQLQKLKIDLKLFLVKWFVTLFTQEFILYDTIKLWDAIVCELDDKDEFMNYISLSLLHWLREEIFKGEFGEVVMKLQNLEKQQFKIQRIIEIALMYKKQNQKK